jgi:ribosomal protein L1
MIFTESLTADEVAQLLTALGAEDKKSGAGEFDTLVAAPFLPADLTQLGKLLGIPNVTPKVPKGKPAVDIRKPLPEGTANEVAATLTKMGNKSTSPAKSEKVAMVVAYSPMNANPSASREIKQFLDRRGDRGPNAKPLMLVLKTIK